MTRAQDASSADAPLIGVTHPMPGCALVTLQRPRALNALSRAMRREFAATLAALAQDGQTRVLVLTGEGRAFCAGVDLRELAAVDAPVQDAGSPDSLDEVNPAQAVLAFPGPVIAAINGPAITGGLELAIACDVLMASERAVFADTHARVGVMPQWGMSQRLPRLIGCGPALEMSLTGNFVDAAQARAWGLVNRVVPHDELLTAALALAADMLSTVPGMLAHYKHLVDEGLAGGLQQGLSIELERAREWSATLDRSALQAQADAVRQRGRDSSERTIRGQGSGA